MRQGSLAALADLLRDQHARKYDLIVPSRAIHAVVREVDADDQTNRRVVLYVDGADFGGVDESGALTTEGLWVAPNDQMDDGIAERLGIPIRYYRRMGEEAPQLLAENINTWLDLDPDRPHMMRTFRNDSDVAIGRALLSDRYQAIDHLDVLFGVLDGLREAAPGAIVDSADLSDKRMRIRVTSPEIAINVRELVEDYMPRGRLIDHSGPGGRPGPRNGQDYPMLFAGFIVSNSETGNGAWSLAPRAVLEVCTNGMTREVDALRRIHLGGRLEEGIVNWSDETRQAQVELIRNQARDAVATFLSTDYLERFRASMAEAKGIEVRHAVRAVEAVRRTLAFTEEQGISILEHFLGSGDQSVLGLAQAITYEAQSTIDDDLAYEMEAGALNAALLAAGA